MGHSHSHTRYTKLFSFETTNFFCHHLTIINKKIAIKFGKTKQNKQLLTVN